MALKRWERCEQLNGFILWACKARLVGPGTLMASFHFSFPLTLWFKVLVSLNMDALPEEWLGYLDKHLLNSFFFSFPIMASGTQPTTMQQAGNRLRKKANSAGLH